MMLPAIISQTSPVSIADRIGGLPLLVRHLKELYKLGVKTFYIDGSTNDAPSLTARLPRDITLHILPSDPSQRAQQLRQLAETSEAILFLRGDWLMDPRLLSTLLNAANPIWLSSAATTAPLSQRIMIAARLSPALAQQWMHADATWTPDAPTLNVDALDTYLPSHRGDKPFYLQAVTTPEEGAAATQTLIQAAQKHTLDLPAQWLHPFFEDRIVLGLCNTRITPNHVTLFTAVLGACAALLFLNGALGMGGPTGLSRRYSRWRGRQTRPHEITNLTAGRSRTRTRLFRRAIMVFLSHMVFRQSYCAIDHRPIDLGPTDHGVDRRHPHGQRCVRQIALYVGSYRIRQAPR